MASVCQQDIVSRGDLLRKEIHEQLVDINAVVQVSMEPSLSLSH